MTLSEKNNPQDWYILYTRNKFEKKIVAQISEREQSVECYLPLQSVTRKWSDRLKTIEVPFFNNYIFVRTAKTNYYNLLQIPGVVKFVSFEGEPAYIHDKEIQQIRLIESHQVPIETVPYYVTGEKVMINKGAFCGIEGIFVDKVREARFVIKIPMFHQAISFEINIDDVSKLN
jgi:transcription elongation factor/antiterminator RfaH